ncbi:MAG TPA: lysophospholipid acyltransferase family protein [Myxococcota bacterium]|nr:lysophospholipid acyltransferase family protein [Myxococcota bacterium]
MQQDAAARWLGRIVPPVLGALYRTWRVRFEGGEPVDAELASGRPMLLLVWHGRLLTVLPHYGPRYALHTMISQSRDGDRIAAVAERMGVTPVRGSSSRGGARALLQALRLLEKGHTIAHIVDGPRGPAGELKPGLMLMAQRSGAALAPMYAASSWHWSAHSWDRMEVPLPCSRVLFRFGPLWRVPPGLDAEGLEALRRDFEAEMRAGYARAQLDVRRRA